MNLQGVGLALRGRALLPHPQGNAAVLGFGRRFIDTILVRATAPSSDPDPPRPIQSPCMGVGFRLVQQIHSTGTILPRLKSPGPPRNRTGVNVSDIWPWVSSGGHYFQRSGSAALQRACVEASVADRNPTVQEFPGRRILIENLSPYLQVFQGNDLQANGQFSRRTGSAGRLRNLFT